MAGAALFYHVDGQTTVISDIILNLLFEGTQSNTVGLHDVYTMGDKKRKNGACKGKMCFELANIFGTIDLILKF